VAAGATLTRGGQGVISPKCVLTGGKLVAVGGIEPPTRGL
jgi:hypothetical protein